MNTYATSDQWLSDLTSLPNNDFVVVWVSNGQDGSSNGIYARHYNSTGGVWGSEFRVNTYTTNSQYSPAVAGFSNGNFIVVWHGQGETGSDEVYAKFYNSTGMPIGNEFQINTYTTSTQGGAEVTILPNDDFVVVWSSYQDGSHYGIYGQRYNSTGIPIGGEFRVNTYTQSYQEIPAVAGLSNNDFVVVWQSFGQNNGYDVYAAINPDYQPVVTVSAGNSNYTENALPVAVDSNLSVSDFDDSTLQGATIMGSNFISDQDRFIFTHQNGITGNFVGNTLILSGNASVAHYQTALRSIFYENTSDNPDTTPRSIRITATDGIKTGDVVTKTVDIIPVNDSPVANAPAINITYNYNDQFVKVAPGVVLSDVDNVELQGAMISISQNFNQEQDRFIFVDQNGISGFENITIGQLELTGNAPILDYQNALRDVLYHNIAEESKINRTECMITIKVYDGSNWSLPLTRQLNFPGGQISSGTKLTNDMFLGIPIIWMSILLAATTTYCIEKATQETIELEMNRCCFSSKPNNHRQKDCTATNKINQQNEPQLSTTRKQTDKSVVRNRKFRFFNFIHTKRAEPQISQIDTVAKISK